MITITHIVLQGERGPLKYPITFYFEEKDRGWYDKTNR